MGASFVLHDQAQRRWMSDVINEVIEEPKCAMSPEHHHAVSVEVGSVSL